MQNLPIKSLVSISLKALIPVLVLSFTVFSLLNILPTKQNFKINSEVEIKVNEAKAVSSLKSIDLGSVLGLNDNPGFTDFCGIVDSSYTPPLPLSSVSATMRNNLCSKGCNVDDLSCTGWTWRYVCNVDPKIVWATQDDPNWTAEQKAALYNRHCTKLTGSQSNIGVTYSRFDSPASSSQTYKADDVGCGKLVQLDVTVGNCEPNANNGDCGKIIDYLVYYTGICVTPTPTPTVAPTPSPTPTPTAVATVACKSLTGIARSSDNTEYPLNNLPENFNGAAVLTCIGDSTVLPITKMEITLSKTLNNNTVNQVVTLTGSKIQPVTNSLCTSGSLCFKGEAIFNINGQGSYIATSQVCNSENLCKP